MADLAGKDGDLARAAARWVLRQVKSGELTAGSFEVEGPAHDPHAGGACTNFIVPLTKNVEVHLRHSAGSLYKTYGVVVMEGGTRIDGYWDKAPDNDIGRAVIAVQAIHSHALVERRRELAEELGLF